jgi:hypothetical protein
VFERPAAALNKQAIAKKRPATMASASDPKCNTPCTTDGTGVVDKTSEQLVETAGASSGGMDAGGVSGPVKGANENDGADAEKF